MKILLVIDTQNDFIDGSLGSKMAQSIVPYACQRIAMHRGPIIATRDTHNTNYLNTLEGKFLPILHCQKNTTGWQIEEKILKEIERQRLIEYYSPADSRDNLMHKLRNILSQNQALVIDKSSFASVDLATGLRELYVQNQLECVDNVEEKSDETLLGVSEKEDGEDSVEIHIMGICTDICVISNALSLRSMLPEISIKVFADSCAGTSREAHLAALEVMRNCHIEVE